ncbi:MAG: ketosteroid isomerase [Alphaproteobacteria bacterium]|jgi:ketosteroid isomerase-like protein|nr:ketosteroid isomerase [Alphaproteobacteria bacterium]
MNFDWNPNPEDKASIKAWLGVWQPCVQNVDFVPARRLFAENVASFGTHMDIVEGRDALEQNQWRSVWPTIDDFAWDFENMRIGVSPDRLMGMLITTWTSTGYHQDGSRFDRPGRSTVVMSRESLDADWLGIHTHFSLFPGTPGRSFGSREPKS